MTDTLTHRGPDGRGIFLDEAVALGHTRLSIIDLSETGDQPIGNEDGSVVCVYNGEIYNFRELRRALEAKGHVFRGTSDGEVIPHLYEEEGEDLFTKLRGMFAVAIYDRRRRRLVLGRDRFGIKPLYYCGMSDAVRFGSEIKAILADPAVPRRVDRQAIHDYLSLMYVPGPATAFLDIREVPPGHFLVWEGRQMREGVFWSAARFRQESGFRAADLDRVGELLNRAVERQLVADVPLGAMLSGGIDSSLVVESASRQRSSNDPPLPTFTVGFSDPEYDESEFAAEVAAACDVSHDILRLEAGGADADLVSRLLLHFDQPFADSSAIPTFLVSREIRREVKVCLSGDGGDELFGGYEQFWRAPFIRRVGRLPAPAITLLAAVLRPGSAFAPDRTRQAAKVLRLSGVDVAQLLFGLSAYLDEQQKATLYRGNGAAPELEPTWRLFEAPTASSSNGSGADRFSGDITENVVRLGLPGDMLRKVDMMSMLNGLEIRVPLLDEDLADLALLLPHSDKVRGRTCKWTLRQLALRRLPERVARKPKWGFGIPLDRWASPGFVDFLHDTLAAPGARIAEFLDPVQVQGWLAAFSGRSDVRERISRMGVYQRVYMALSLELWLRHHSPS